MLIAPTGPRVGPGHPLQRHSALHHPRVSLSRSRHGLGRKRAKQSSDIILRALPGSAGPAREPEEPHRVHEGARQLLGVSALAFFSVSGVGRLRQQFRWGWGGCAVQPIQHAYSTSARKALGRDTNTQHKQAEPLPAWTDSFDLTRHAAVPAALPQPTQFLAIVAKDRATSPIIPPLLPTLTVSAGDAGSSSTKPEPARATAENPDAGSSSPVKNRRLLRAVWGMATAPVKLVVSCC
jgi:hypothetical protein